MNNREENPMKQKKKQPPTDRERERERERKTVQPRETKIIGKTQQQAR